jgi:hypothetical protein
VSSVGARRKRAIDIDGAQYLNPPKFFGSMVDQLLLGGQRGRTAVVLDNEWKGKMKR